MLLVFCTINSSRQALLSLDSNDLVLARIIFRSPGFEFIGTLLWQGSSLSYDNTFVKISSKLLELQMSGSSI